MMHSPFGTACTREEITRSLCNAKSRRSRMRQPNMPNPQNLGSCSNQASTACSIKHAPGWHDSEDSLPAQGAPEDGNRPLGSARSVQRSGYPSVKCAHHRTVTLPGVVQGFAWCERRHSASLDCPRGLLLHCYLKRPAQTDRRSLLANGRSRLLRPSFVPANLARGLALAQLACGRR